MWERCFQQIGNKLLHVNCVIGNTWRERRLNFARINQREQVSEQRRLLRQPGRVARVSHNAQQMLQDVR